MEGDLMTASPWADTSVTEDPLDASSIAEAVARRDSGAIVEFRGVVRDHDEDRGVRGLTYEAHPRAADVLSDVVRAVLARHADVRAASVHHRVGPLQIGDVAFVVAASAPHRAEAFAAVSELVDETKARLPVWKHQHFADGTESWVNAP